MTLRWGTRLATALPALSITLHAGFYLSPYKGHFLRLIGTPEFVPMAIASWTVSKIFPACFTTLRQVILFAVLIPILASSEGFLLGLGIDAFLNSRLHKTVAD